MVALDDRVWELQFDQPRIERLRSLSVEDAPLRVPDLDGAGLGERLARVEVLLTGWGTPRLDAGRLARLPRLHTVLHCAGSVRPVVSPELWRRGIAVSSSADINAEPVAEFTCAAVVMAAKKAPFLAADARRHREDWSYRERRGTRSTTGLTVGLVGFSRIGRRVARMLVERLPDVTCLVSDPFADPAEVAAVGARLVTLEEMLPRLDVLSIHAPQLPATYRMIGAAQLAALPDHACLINTARGSLVDTAALEQECVRGRLHAVLDVTDPEPLPSDSPLYDLPNVVITPHIAGSLDEETRRMTDGALDELARVVAGRPLQRQVREAELDRMA
ncbi:hydroxyacid dehydrogenase [Auraticoccus sp. F435]|uniref:Hydroxyacid dehydrogenase n=1 Tax=Auraticoccus cholistanensis TaxID=2656650 RepID=A0A6A9V178_9ACTN|nr:hydroxyacid dehydrogenase [Auraticoccus cholistanensis]MVA76620.1 hydroxyacid dehydrogenase [Auraticoccus cholistanensis]